VYQKSYQKRFGTYVENDDEDRKFLNKRIHIIGLFKPKNGGDGT
jgi:hypothetical protein